jgi:hypothetical protein
MKNKWLSDRLKQLGLAAFGVILMHLADGADPVFLALLLILFVFLIFLN